MSDSVKTEVLDKAGPGSRRSKSRVLIETMIVAVITSVVATVAQKLIFGASSIPVSVVLTVLMEVLYFKTLAKRF